MNLLNIHLTEKGAHKLYNIILEELIKKDNLGNTTTYSNDIHKIGEKYLGKKFAGVFPSDKIPKLNSFKKYAVINIDTSKQSGSHWVAIAFIEKNKIMAYDSFSHLVKTIKPSLKKKYQKISFTDDDIEQDLSELNCGARALSWCIFYEFFGHDNAMLI